MMMVIENLFTKPACLGKKLFSFFKPFSFFRIDKWRELMTKLQKEVLLRKGVRIENMSELILEKNTYICILV